MRCFNRVKRSQKVAWTSLEAPCLFVLPLTAVQTTGRTNAPQGDAWGPVSLPVSDAPPEAVIKYLACSPGGDPTGLVKTPQRDLCVSVETAHLGHASVT